MLSIILPANNEEAWIGPCLEALLAQDRPAAALGGVELIVAANACTDATVARVEAFRAAFEAAGWRLVVLDLATPGKLNALNAGDAAACPGSARLYLDADVLCSPPLLGQIADALAGPAPRYVSGRLELAPARSFATRHFGRLWRNLPFMRTNVPGAGLFAVNAAGRTRWGDFPPIISDDGFVRLCFAPEERQSVAASYVWPLVEGFWPLVRVRRRQDAGSRELAEKYPDLLKNESKPPLKPADYLRLFVSQPLDFAVYVTVILMVRFGPGRKDRAWRRGR